ncbi:hypothetical protein GGD83_004571 [Rhodoblastus sphagnicola]|uniref:hypothetical protein n=1 Tax=Rhodoblastus sphagnicola TaxID=333368 RepID=UPI0016228A9D|nr:hypothetical protein [Rhodoblastus sphagnicola]MBB4200742.1 hypothetical protein [Rhodoblastus sphagnicola]
MANNRKAPAQSATPAKQPKPAITFERAKLLCPDQGKAERIAENFGLFCPDYENIRDQHSLALLNMRDGFDSALNEKATALHFQRIVGALVGSAVGAGSFYSDKVSEARTLATRTHEGGQEDEAPVGFENKARRAAEFAAEMGLQAYALLAAAHGAVDAFKDITGEEWKPYRAPAENQPLEQRALKTQLDAL